MRYLIIGNCAAGIHAVEAIRSVDNKGELIVVSDENCLPYCRCLLSYYLAGTHEEEDLLLRPKGFYEKMKVRPLLGKKVTSVDPSKKKAALADGEEIGFDRLLIATGSSAKSLGVEGEEKAGVFKFRTIADARGILEMAKAAKKVLVLGGGLIGLKAAYGLKQRGLDVTVVVKSNQVMSQVVDRGAAEIVRAHLENNGIKIMTGLGPARILGKNKVEGAALDNGQELDCGLVIVGKGVNANTDLAKDTDIKTHWGIVVDPHMQTSIEGIFAAGDCAEAYDIAFEEPMVNALWTTATEQGRIAGFNMAGEARSYDGSIAENSVEFFDLPIVSLGITRPKEGYEEIVRRDPSKMVYKKLVLKENKVVGAVLVGRFENTGVILSLVKERVDVSTIKDILLEDWFSYGRVKDLFPEKAEPVARTVSIDGRRL